VRRWYGEVKVNLIAFLVWHWMKMSGQFHAPVAFSLRKTPFCPVDTMVGGPHILSEGFRGDKTVLLLALKQHLLQGL